LLSSLSLLKSLRSGTKVLVVDDEPYIRYALEETVTAEGFECLAAAYLVKPFRNHQLTDVMAALLPPGSTLLPDH
jgi:DNA-binding response OmpR family regulator